MISVGSDLELLLGDVLHGVVWQCVGLRGGCGYHSLNIIYHLLLMLGMVLAGVLGMNLETNVGLYSLY